MTQTCPATAVLGPGKTGLAIGLRVLDIDRVQYSAFSTTGVAETSTLGTYSKAGGAVVPDAGGYIVWGVVGTDYAEATVDSTSVNVTYLAGLSVPVDNLVLALGTGGLVEKLNSMLEAAGLAYRFTAAALAEAPTEAGIGAITFTYTLTSSVNASPIADADVWVTTDSAGSNVIAVGRTNAAGQVVFYLDAGTVYVWRQKTGWTFANPDTEVVA